MVRDKAFKTWRKDTLLKHNTLLAVVTMPPQLFYPTGAPTVGIFVRKGKAHPAAQPVLWLRAIHDGYRISKSKRLPDANEANDYESYAGLVKGFLQNPNMEVPNIVKVMKSAPVDYDDPLLELVPENYVDQPLPDVAQLMQGAEKLVRGTVAFVIQEGLEDGI